MGETYTGSPPQHRTRVVSDQKNHKRERWIDVPWTPPQASIRPVQPVPRQEDGAIKVVESYSALAQLRHKRPTKRHYEWRRGPLGELDNPPGRYLSRAKDMPVRAEQTIVWVPECLWQHKRRASDF